VGGSACLPHVLDWTVCCCDVVAGGKSDTIIITITSSPSFSLCLQSVKGGEKAEAKKKGDDGGAGSFPAGGGFGGQY
jgi:hypothetical protein